MNATAVNYTSLEAFRATVSNADLKISIQHGQGYKLQDGELLFVQPCGPNVFHHHYSEPGSDEVLTREFTPDQIVLKYGPCGWVFIPNEKPAATVTNSHTFDHPVEVGETITALREKNYEWVLYDVHNTGDGLTFYVIEAAEDLDDIEGTWVHEFQRMPIGAHVQH